MGIAPAPGLVLGGKYRLDRALAGGGMGSVWVARHLKLDAAVAVKLMAAHLADTTSSAARFEREAKACAQLSSPHVVHVHDFGVEDGTAYIVMELLTGEDLGDRLDRVGRMSLVEAIGYAVPMAKALRVAHDAGLVHRDLKPRNVFIARQGEDEVLKLVDFGIARETRTQLVDDRTSSGVVLGSPYHMAPEQAQAHPVDHRADLWAFGVMLYRMLVGRRPFEGDVVTVVLMAICSMPHPAPTSLVPDLPPAIDAFFERALAKDPARRFQSARELVDALVRVAEGRADAPPSGEPSRPSLTGSGAPATVNDPAPSVSGGAVPSFTPASAPDLRDGTASRALTVSTLSPQRAAGAPRAIMAVAVAAAVLGIGAAYAFFGRKPASSDPTAASPSAVVASSSSLTAASAEPTTGAQAPSASPAPDASPAAATPSVAPSGPAATSSSPAALSALPATAPPPRPGPRPPPPRPPPAGGPAIDPFTGLPVSR